MPQLQNQTDITPNASVPAQFLTCHAHAWASLEGWEKYPTRRRRRASERKGREAMKDAMRMARDKRRILGCVIRREVESCVSG